MITLLDAYRGGMFQRDQLWPNVVAGVIVGVVALPLAMAFAIASGARPEQGLHTAIVAGLLVSVLGGSRTQIAGPTGAFVVILAGVTAKYGVDGLQTATLMAGAMLVLMGVCQMGAVIKFIPAPVIVGFTAGIGVLIWVGQWQYFFGYPPVRGAHFHETLWLALQALPHAHPATSAIGAASLAIVIVTGRIRWLQRVPGPLWALAAATALQATFQFDGVATIGTAFGEIPRQLPAPALPPLSMARLIELTGPAFTIAMLGAIESLLSAVIADGMTGAKHDANQELIGQGIANIVAPVFGGFAATGAIARTATSIRNGGSSPLAGMVHAVTLVLTIVLLAPLASHVPLAALAAILFVVAFNMSELRHVLHMARRAPRADTAILVITFLLTVLTDLVIAVNIGVILATLQFLRRMAESVDVQPQTAAQLRSELNQHGWQELPPGVMVYGIDGPFFFGAVENFERALALSHTDPQVLVLRLGRMPFLDITGIQTLEEVIGKLQRRGVQVLLCEANPRVAGKLEKAGVLAQVGAGHLMETFSAALLRSRELVAARRPASHQRSAAVHQLLKTSEKFFLGEKR